MVARHNPASIPQLSLKACSVLIKSTVLFSNDSSQDNFTLPSVLLKIEVSGATHLNPRPRSHLVIRMGKHKQS
jgi:hypothetical protein